MKEGGPKKKKYGLQDIGVAQEADIKHKLIFDQQTRIHVR